MSNTKSYQKIVNSGFVVLLRKIQMQKYIKKQFQQMVANQIGMIIYFQFQSQVKSNPSLYSTIISFMMTYQQVIWKRRQIFITYWVFYNINIYFQLTQKMITKPLIFILMTAITMHFMYLKQGKYNLYIYYKELEPRFLHLINS